MTTDTAEPLYERFTVAYSASGTVIPSFYYGGATLREVQVTHPPGGGRGCRGFTGECRGGQDMTVPRRTRGKAAKGLKLIASSIEILAEIQPASVRAVCYQLFIKALLSDMGKSCTSGVSKQLVYAREIGSIPWAWIVDETREPERVPSWDDPEQFALVVQRSYRRDRWAQQPRRVEVWSEKGTGRG